MKNRVLFFLLFLLCVLCGCASPRPGAGLEKYSCIETTPQYCILAYKGNRIKLHANREYAICNGTPLKLPVAPHYDAGTGLFTVAPDIRDRILEPLLNGTRLRKSLNLIVIDAGHGGHDTGARGAFSLEKKLNLALAHELRNALSAKGFRVKMTREGDHYLPLKERVEFAEQQDAGLFISLHCNSSRSNPQAAGVECFARKLPLPESTALALYVQQQLVRRTGFADRGVKFADFVVVKQKIPAILIETGFLSNRGEERYLNSARYRRQAAEAIAAAVRHFAAPAPAQTLNTSGAQKSGSRSNRGERPAAQK